MPVPPVATGPVARNTGAKERTDDAAMPESLATRLQEKLDLPDGYSLRFPAEDLEAVEQFVWDERQRRPGVSVEIRFSRADRSVWVTVRG
jgi:hypothetical protein